MLQIKDLNLAESVLPLFDYTNNQQAAALLATKLEELPGSVEMILERQSILKGIMANWPVLEGFTYQRFDFKEVYTFFEGLASNRIVLDDHRFKTTLKLMVMEEEKYKRRSQLVQLVLFLTRIQQSYFKRIDKSSLPTQFRQSLGQALQFLNKLGLETVETQIRNDHFSVSQIVAFSRKLNALSSSEITQFWKFYFEFEVYWSIAKGIIKHKLSFPSFDVNSFHITDFYHPSLQNPVKNAITFKSEEHVVLLTGPNMSGKSTLLKAIGICVYLAHAGVGVPASVCQLPFYNSIVVAINLNDSLQDGYSHFMTEIRNLKMVLDESQKNKKCFALFDEIFRGTNIDDALEITKSTVNGLCKFPGSTFFISTHLLQLESELTARQEYLKKMYIDCALENGEPSFTYILKEGWSQLKIGKILFDKEGLTEILSV